MRGQMHTIWRVPVFCLISSWISFYVTVYLGRFFFVVKTTGEDGTISVSADPVRSTVFHVVLFAGILLLGGLLIFRSMTKAEIAISAATMSAVYLIIDIMQLLGIFPASVSVTIAMFQNWTSMIASLLYQATHQLTASALLAAFAPLLFIPFGRKNTDGKAK